MGVIDLFSKRKRREQATMTDVFAYDPIPQGFRIQVVHILQDAFGSHQVGDSAAIWRQIHKGLAREYGKFSLGSALDDDFAAVVNFILKTPITNEVLDFVELSFQVVDGYCREYCFHRGRTVGAGPDGAIEELNTRFLENGLGYTFVNGQIIRKDSEFIHQNIVMPALHFLQDARYQGANEEYLSAHEHYRHGRHKECLNDCLKSFESTMKTICEVKEWSYSNNDTANTLIKICFQNELIPAFLQNEVGSLRAALEGGIPTVRNRLGGHGQGLERVEVPAYFSSFLLNLTASTITFMVDAAGA